MLSIASLVRKDVLSPDSSVCSEAGDNKSMGLGCQLNPGGVLRPMVPPKSPSGCESLTFFLPPSNPYNPNYIFNKNNLVEKVQVPGFEEVFERQQEIIELAKALIGLQTCKVSLQGQPFSGKKSVVQGLAQKIKNNSVPPCLRDYAILDVCGFLSDLNNSNLMCLSGSFKGKTIFLIKSTDEFIGYTNEGSFAAQELLALIKKPQIPTITIRSCSDKGGYCQDLGMFFWVIRIIDPSKHQFQPILRIQAEKITKIFGCVFSNDVLDLVETVSRNERKFLESLSLIRKSFLLLDRLGSDFEFRKFEDPQQSCYISRQDVLSAAKAIFSDRNIAKCPSYIS